MMNSVFPSTASRAGFFAAWMLLAIGQASFAGDQPQWGHAWTRNMVSAETNLPSSFDAIGSRLDNAALLHRAGVTLAFTQFGESANARKIRQLAGNAVAHGLPKNVALAAVTHTPAEIFGIDNRGQIAVGEAADLVLWSGDPLEVTSVAEQVWIAGAAVEMRSRQTELRDRYLAE